MQVPFFQFRSTIGAYEAPTPWILWKQREVLLDPLQPLFWFEDAHNEILDSGQHQWILAGSIYVHSPYAAGSLVSTMGTPCIVDADENQRIQEFAVRSRVLADDVVCIADAPIFGTCTGLQIREARVDID